MLDFKPLITMDWKRVARKDALRHQHTAYPQDGPSSSFSDTQAMSHSVPLAVTSAELVAAREYVQQGKLHDAEGAYRRTLVSNPTLPEALRFLANAALARGDPGEAVNLLNRAADANRNDPEILLELGTAYQAGKRLDAARYVLERAVASSENRGYVARVFLANVLELDHRPEEALLQYFRAILEAQGRGRWLGDDSTEPGLRRLVNHAMHYVARERRAMFERELRDFKGTANWKQLHRVDDALSIYLREREERPADPSQKPSFLFVPGLDSGKFIDISRFKWIEDFCNQVANLADEIGACASAASISLASNPFNLDALLGTTESPKERKTMNRVAIYQRGALHEHARSHAPRLLSALDSAPLVHIRGHGPDAEVISLAPKMRLPISYGRTNSRVVVVIGMEDASDMSIIVGGEERALRARQAEVFDPTFGYEYANHSSAPCRALAFEVWHPDLSSDERGALEILTATAVAFDTRLQELS